MALNSVQVILSEYQIKRINNPSDSCYFEGVSLIYVNVTTSIPMKDETEGIPHEWLNYYEMQIHRLSYRYRLISLNPVQIFYV